MNSTKHLLHPELQVMAETAMISDINDENLNEIRQTLGDLKLPLADASSFNVKRREVLVPQEKGPDVRCLLYIPEDRKDDLGPAYLTYTEGVIFWVRLMVRMQKIYYWLPK